MLGLIRRYLDGPSPMGAQIFLCALTNSLHTERSIERRRMNAYPKFTTTVIGAHSVPTGTRRSIGLCPSASYPWCRWPTRNIVRSQAAILDQEIAGIDVITGGEMHRRTHNRHRPPNAMLNYFWQKIPAFQGSTRPSRSPRTTRTSSILRRRAGARIDDNVDLGLVDEFKMVSALTTRPVKITMTGPHMLSKVAYDEHYSDILR